ncbi:hypothetical protein C4A76_14870 [Brevibacillus laterosporus]|uniref:YopX family protein n=1 Tax=Brevibacillus laterosporus TaxID=1465 RepID=UPI000CE3B914|nr:YopX family protein [Brevibacillus laterosporus]PPA85925.1 hypothetical protein C4A76_14870 [Brevibacillus laterosporus]
MREMKFQAYWKEKGIMLGVSSIDFSTYVSDGKSSNLSRFYTLDDYEDKSNYIPKGTNFNLYLDEVEIRQYTGLKDRNGKEIYKGDIVKRNFEIGRVVINPISLGAEDYEIDDSGYFIGVVSYRPSEGYVLNKCKKFNDDDELQSKKSGVKIYPNHAEVIGNIYENPELLEKAQ